MLSNSQEVHPLLLLLASFVRMCVKTVLIISPLQCHKGDRCLPRLSDNTRCLCHLFFAPLQTCTEHNKVQSKVTKYNKASVLVEHAVFFEACGVLLDNFLENSPCEAAPLESGDEK